MFVPCLCIPYPLCGHHGHLAASVVLLLAQSPSPPDLVRSWCSLSLACASPSPLPLHHLTFSAGLGILRPLSDRAVLPSDPGVCVQTHVSGPSCWPHFHVTRESFSLTSMMTVPGDTQLPNAYYKPALELQGPFQS